MICGSVTEIITTDGCCILLTSAWICTSRLYSFNERIQAQIINNTGNHYAREYYYQYRLQRKNLWSLNCNLRRCYIISNL